jgi:hypothetical protein
VTTFAPVREAYKLWLLTAPQLTLDLDEIDAPPCVEAVAAPPLPLPREGASRTAQNYNGPWSQSSDGIRATRGR